MTSPLTLVIDQGTHATRAFAFDPTGQIQTTAYTPIGLERLSADRIEQDPAEIVASMHQVVAEILGNGLVQQRGIARAGLATQRSSVVAWDRETGEPLSPVLSWQDRRAAGRVAALADLGAKIKARNGLPLNPHYGASKLRWLLDNNGAVQTAQAEGRLAMGPLASYLLFHLLAERPFLVDDANAARTQLNRLDTRDWDPWLLELFGVPRELLPTCRPIEHAYGRLAAAAIPLAAVNGDQNAAVYALGEPPEGTAVVNLGTGAFVLIPTGPQLVTHPQLLSGLISSTAESGTYTIEGTVNGAGAALSWASETWDIPDIPPQLDGWLAQTNEPPIFLNSIGGLGSPHWRAGPEPQIVGEGTPAAHIAAVAESILFLLQENLNAMRTVGVTAQRIQISGGLSRSAALCQRLADLSGALVYRPNETEATARGAAWLAAGRPASWPETSPGISFEPQANPGLQARYVRFRELMGFTQPAG